LLSAWRGERPRAAPVPGERRKALAGRAAEVTFVNLDRTGFDGDSVVPADRLI